MTRFVTRVDTTIATSVDAIVSAFTVASFSRIGRCHHGSTNSGSYFLLIVVDFPSNLNNKNKLFFDQRENNNTLH